MGPLLYGHQAKAVFEFYRIQTNLLLWQETKHGSCAPVIQKFSSDFQSKKLHGYRIKLHEQLVLVS